MITIISQLNIHRGQLKNHHTLNDALLESIKKKTLDNSKLVINSGVAGPDPGRGGGGGGGGGGLVGGCV